MELQKMKSKRKDEASSWMTETVVCSVDYKQKEFWHEVWVADREREREGERGRERVTQTCLDREKGICFD